MKKDHKQSAPSITTHAGLRITPDKVTLTLTSKQLVKKHAELPLEPGIIDNGELAQPEKLSAVLSQLFKQLPVPDKYISLEIPEHTVFIRSYKFRNIPLEEIQERLAIEVEPELPMPADKIYLDWCWLPDSNGFVQIAALPRKVLDKYLEIINSLKIIPLAIETSSLTLNRLVTKTEEPALVIDADTTSTLITLNPDHSTNLSAISQSSIPGQLSGELPQVINDMINYCKKKYQTEIKKIFYTGALQDQLSISLPQSIPSEPINNLKSVSPAQMMGYSLAQMPIAAPEDPRTINLIPPSIQQDYNQATTHHLKRQLLTISAIFLLILNITSGVFLGLILSLNKPSPEDSLQEITGSGLDLLNQITTINQQAQAVIEISQQKQLFSQAFQELLSTLPSDITINHIKFETSNQMVAIRGFAPKQDQILALKEALENSVHFEQVNLPLSVLETTENIEFSLKFKWKHQIDSDS